MEFRSTRDVATMLGLNPSRLARAVWDGRLKAPAKAPGGAYLWTPSDIEKASWLLRGRGAGDLLAVEETVEETSARSTESDPNAAPERSGETRADMPASKPRLQLTQDQAAIRHAAKDKIAARYGFTDWSDAPDGALRDYVDFLRTCTEAKP